MTPSEDAQPVSEFPRGDGEMAALIRTLDWSRTSLGPPAKWPSALRHAVSTSLHTPIVSAVYWGPELLTIYNDAYAQARAERHPGALGRPLAEVWPEIADVLVPQVSAVIASGRGFSTERQLTRIERHGRVVDTHWVYSFAPIEAEDGSISGVFVTAMDTTAAVVADRALQEERDQTAGVLAGMTDDYALLDRNFRILDVNAEALRLESRSREVILGQTHWEAYPGTETTELGRLYKQAMLERVTVSLEHRYLWDDGRETWLEMRAYPVEQGLAVFYRDITSRKQVEASRDALVELGGRLRDLDDPNEVAFAAAEILARTLGVGRAGYGTVDLGSETITIERDWNATGIKSLAGTLQFRDYGSYIEDLKLGRTVVVADARQDPRTAADAAALESISARSFINMPLTEQGGLVALLFLNHDVAREWSADELTLVRDVAERTRSAVERRRAEQELRVSEARFEAIANSIDQMVWSTRPDGFHDYYNQRWYDFTGVPKGSTDGEAWNGMFHPEDQERAWARWRHSLETGEPYHIEYRLRHRSGGYRWVLGRAQPVRNPHGNVTRWFGTCTDIQEIVEAREVLSRSREELEREIAERTAERDRVWRYSRDLLAVVGADGVVRAANPAWSSILGYNSEEIIGRSFLDLVSPDDVEQTHGALGKATTTKADVTNLENRYTHKDGSTRWLSWRTSTEGDLIYAYGRDITAEKGALAELARTEEALRQAQKMEAVGQLTGGIAHDFNNLLTGITGSLELMSAKIALGRFDSVERYVSAAEGAAKRAAALTHRLLAFSRRQTLDPKATNVNRLVGEMEDLIRRTIGPHVDLEVVGAGGLWPTLVDPSQLENALLNLCINARDAMPQGGRITIETANKWLDERAAAGHDMPPGQYLSLCVTDTGTGMTPEVVARAFDPFFTTKPHRHGNRARPLDDLWLRAPERRSGAHLLRGRKGHDDLPVSAALPGRGAGGGRACSDRKGRDCRSGGNGPRRRRRADGPHAGDRSARSGRL